MSDKQNGPNRMERKKDKMRQNIICVAVDLFAKQGFNVTTMEQIAAVADIAKKTLYNYFPEKEAILSAHIQNFVQELDVNLDEFLALHTDVRSRLLAMFAIQAKMYETDPEFLKIYVAYRVRTRLNPSQELELRSGTEGLFAKVLLAAQKTGELRDDIPARNLARYLEMSYFVTIMDWVTDQEHLSLSDSFVRCIDIFLDGARAIEHN